MTSKYTYNINLIKTKSVGGFQIQTSEKSKNCTPSNLFEQYYKLIVVLIGRSLSSLLISMGRGIDLKEKKTFSVVNLQCQDPKKIKYYFPLVLHYFGSQYGLYYVGGVDGPPPTDVACRQIGSKRFARKKRSFCKSRSFSDPNFRKIQKLHS